MRFNSRESMAEYLENTKKETYQREIVLAHYDGQKLDFRFIGTDSWKLLDSSDSIDFDQFAYKFHKEPKYEPYEDCYHPSLLGKVVKFKYNNDTYMIIGQTQRYVCLGNRNVIYKNLFEGYCFEDGSPCGKEVL